MMPTALKPGDVLLYRPSDLIGWLIAIKTWGRWSHVEVAVRPGKSIGARPAGVNYYDTRWSKLGMVLRPKFPMDLAAGLKWFDETARGQSYDVLGLFRFFIIPGLKQSQNKQFCSELAVRFYRQCGFNLFPNEDADLIAPRTFLLSDDFECIWSDAAGV